MNISSRCEYACRAILELATHADEKEVITSETIAQRRNIPEKYLVHVLLQLKRAGLVRSVRGARGGYLLRRSADKITLLDIVTVIDGPVLAPLPVQDDASEETAPVWREAASKIAAELASVTIRDILDRKPTRPMFYI
jgi:Rrf2 family protein